MRLTRYDHASLKEPAFYGNKDYVLVKIEARTARCSVLGKLVASFSSNGKIVAIELLKARKIVSAIDK